MTQSLFIFLIIIFISVSCSDTDVKHSSTDVDYYTAKEMAPLKLPFSDAVRVDNILYLSGQIGILPGKLELVPGGMSAEAKQVMENIKSILEAHGTSFDNVIKCTVMLADISEWAAFNQIYKSYFPQNKPARSALGVNGLALGARVEMECIVVIP